MFCSTENGVKSIIRQLNPDAHYESDITAITDMVQHLRKIICIGVEDLNKELHGIQIKATIKNLHTIEALIRE